MAGQGTGSQLRWPKWVAALALADLVILNLVDLLVFRPMAGGLVLPDLRSTGYTLADMASWLNALGEAGRASVLRWHSFSLDLTLPILLCFAIGGLTLNAARGLPRFAAMPIVWQMLTAFAAPACYMLADYAENRQVATMLLDPAKATLTAVNLASALTILKYASITLALCILAAFMLARLYAGRRAR